MKVFMSKRLFLVLIITLISSISFHYFTPTHQYKTIAHRGASKFAPENTMAAFKKAYELGYDFIELDVRMSKDKELIVIHDETINRTTNGTGYVHEWTVEELKQLDAGSWFSKEFYGEKIPLLHEVFDEFAGKIGLLIEIKESPFQEEIVIKVADYLRQKLNEGYDPNHIFVQSFLAKDMQLFHQLLPDLKAGIIIKHPIHIFLLANYRHYASFLSIHYYYLSKSLIDIAKMLDYEIFTWSIHHSSQLFLIERFSVNGIISTIIDK